MTDSDMIHCADPERQIERLRTIMHRLRSPGGCPWDAEQTHATLIPNLIEETYETITAIRENNPEDLCEELGDLLLQVVFHSEIAESAGRFNLDEVARTIGDKLVRRHPHVFEKSGATTTEEVLHQWDKIKRDEKGHQKEYYLHDIGKGLPALLRASKIQKKAAKIGFDWPVEIGALAKVREEIMELQASIDAQDMDAVTEELGDLLFSVVNLARYRNIDPEILLSDATDKFERRFNAMEEILRGRKIPLAKASTEQMEDAWEQVKTSEAHASE
ncbi:MAG: nucleoside triphosphate pyrophosphohydrolase [Luteolibacter sp.]|jgi:MazG family protein